MAATTEAPSQTTAASSSSSAASSASASSASGTDTTSEPAADAANTHPPAEALDDLYSHEGTRMRHARVYKACPWFWRLAGAFYRELDLGAGVLFVVSALGFFLVPLMRLYFSEANDALNIALCTATAVFLIAMFLQGTRATYAALWKRPHKRPSGLYHVAIWLMVAAAVVYLLVSVGGIEKWAAHTTGILSCITGYLFLLPSVMFTVDGYLMLKPRLFTNLDNQYFWGSAMLLVASVLVSIAGTCEAIAGRTFPSPPGHPKHEAGICTEHVALWLHCMGGLAFEIGGVQFLIFAAVEYYEMHNGPDSGYMASHQQGEPHPYHHEPWHLE